MTTDPPEEIVDDVIVTQDFIPDGGLFGLFMMQVCAHSEVPPEQVERRANELNQFGDDGHDHRWTICWGKGAKGEGVDGPNKAPIQCEQQPERIHYLLSC